MRSLRRGNDIEHSGSRCALLLYAVRMRRATVISFPLFVLFVLLMINAALSEEPQTPGVATSTLSSSTVATAPSADIQTPDIFRVVRVVDGDTLVLNIDGKDTRVRLIGLDTPESVDPREKVECFGIEAAEKAKEMLEGKNVRVEKDQSQAEYDAYGRLLAYVYVGDTLFNEYMIAEGYGHEYTYRIPYKYRSQFKAAEREARDAKRGLWADGVCETQ